MLSIALFMFMTHVWLINQINMVSYWCGVIMQS